MKPTLLLIFLVFPIVAKAIDCSDSLKNGLSISSSEAQVISVLGSPVRKFQEIGAYDFGLSYDGITFEFMDDYAMLISISSELFPLSNGVYVGMPINMSNQRITSWETGESKDDDCGCIFEIANKQILSIDLACPI